MKRIIATSLGLALMVSTGVLATMQALGVFTPSKVSAIDTAPTMVALPDEAGVLAEYRFTFVVTGSMTVGNGTIKITFDKDTQIPATISRNNVLIKASRLSNNSPDGTIGATGSGQVVPLQFDPVIENDTTDPRRKVVIIKVPDMNPSTSDPGIGAQGIGTGYGTIGGMTDESLLGLGGDPARHHEVFSQVTVTFTTAAGLKNATVQETSSANIVARNTILWPNSINLVTGGTTATVAISGATVTVPALTNITVGTSGAAAVNVLNVPGGNLGAYQFQVSYNPAVVQATGVLGGAAPFDAVTAVNITNPVTGSGVAKWNHFQGGQAPVSPVSHNLANVVFQAVGMAGQCTTLHTTVIALVNNQGVHSSSPKQGGEVCLVGIQAMAQTDLRAAQDVADPALPTGVKPTIDQITSTVTGTAVTGVLIHSYEANINFPPALAQGTACRLKPPINLAPSDCTINPTVGQVHLKATTGVTGSGVATPLDPLAFVGLRLLGSNNPAVGNTTVNLNFVEIRDSLGSLIPQASPPDTRTFLRGDALADGSISIGDALYIGQHLVNPTTRPAGEDPGTVNPVNAGSVNHDTGIDVITLADAVKIAQFLVGNLNQFYVAP